VIADDPIHLHAQRVLPQHFYDLHVAFLQSAQTLVVEQVARQDQPLGL